MLDGFMKVPILGVKLPYCRGAWLAEPLMRRICEGVMVLNFSWLPPEINSARIFAGAGSGSLFTAASAWDGLASDLSASASSFHSVLSGLANGPGQARPRCRWPRRPRPM